MSLKRLHLRARRGWLVLVLFCGAPDRVASKGAGLGLVNIATSNAREININKISLYVDNAKSMPDDFKLFALIATDILQTRQDGGLSGKGKLSLPTPHSVSFGQSLTPSL